MDMEKFEALTTAAQAAVASRPGPWDEVKLLVDFLNGEAEEEELNAVCKGDE